MLGVLVLVALLWLPDHRRQLLLAPRTVWSESGGCGCAARNFPPQLLGCSTGFFVNRTSRQANRSMALVVVHYRGRLSDGTVFVNSYEGGKPQQVALGENHSGVGKKGLQLIGQRWA